MAVEGYLTDARNIVVGQHAAPHGFRNPVQTSCTGCGLGNIWPPAMGVHPIQEMLTGPLRRLRVDYVRLWDKPVPKTLRHVSSVQGATRGLAMSCTFLREKTAEQLIPEMGHHF
jgi:hypothetical protein